MKRSFYWSRLFAGKRRAHNAKLQQRHGSSSGTVSKNYLIVYNRKQAVLQRNEAGGTKIATDRSNVPGGTSNFCRYKLVGYRAQSIPRLRVYEYGYVGIHRIAQVAAEDARCLYFIKFPIWSNWIKSKIFDMDNISLVTASLFHFSGSITYLYLLRIINIKSLAWLA